MNILIPIFAFAASGGGRVLSELSNNWIENGHEVSFIAFAYSKEPYFPTKANIIWLNSSGNKVDTNKTNSKRFPLDVLYLRKKLKKAIEIYGTKSDVILASHSFTAYSVFKANIDAKKYYYIQAYEPEFYTEGKLATIYKRISKNSYSYKLTRIVNAELYKSYKEIKSEFVVPPGIDFKIFYPKTNKESDEIILGCIGRIEKWKGTQVVLDAFNVLNKKYNKVKLHIAFGNDELSNRSNIKIVTPKNDFELADFYRSIDVLIAPGSIQLGAYHYPVLEAMSCGTVVITTGYSGANDNNAFIVPVNDVMSIVHSIEQIMQFPEITNKKIIKAFNILKGLEWQNISSKMLEIFKK